nr:40S ribosomal protein S13 [Ipomoea batatas]
MDPDYVERLHVVLLRNESLMTSPAFLGPTAFLAFQMNLELHHSLNIYCETSLAPHYSSETRFVSAYPVGIEVCRASATFATMGRMHSRSKGISSSALPYKRTPPNWLKISSGDVEDNICKFTKRDMTPSQIGVILRDSHGIAQVKSVIGSKILRILKAHGFAPEIPEDLYHLIKKVVAIRKHLERNRKDKDSKFCLF